MIAVCALVMPVVVQADLMPIHLEFRPIEASAPVDQPVALGLWAYTAPEQTQLFRALDMVFVWEPEYLRLEALNSIGAVSLLSSGFPAADGYGLNEIIPPRDGDGYYKAWAQLGQPLQVTDEGVLLTTFVFRALQPIESTTVTIAPSGGHPMLETAVWGGSDANTLVTGTLGHTTIQIVPEPRSAVPWLFSGVLALRRRA